MGTFAIELVPVPRLALVHSFSEFRAHLLDQGLEFRVVGLGFRVWGSAQPMKQRRASPSRGPSNFPSNFLSPIKTPRSPDPEVIQSPGLGAAGAGVRACPPSAQRGSNSVCLLLRKNIGAVASCFQPSQIEGFSKQLKRFCFLDQLGCIT